MTPNHLLFFFFSFLTDEMGQERETDEGRCGFEEQGKEKEGKRCTRTEMGNDSILSSPSLINHHSCRLIACIFPAGVNIMTGWR